MKKEYSKKEMERILKQDMDVPEKVEERINDTYKALGIEVKEKTRYRMRHKKLVAVAAIAALVTGMSIVTVAASKFLSANLVEKEDTVKYEFEVDQTTVAHEIEVTPTYMPAGYELGEENSPYGGKWHNYETDGTITIWPMNAAEIDRMERTGNAEFMEYDKDTHIKTIDIGGAKADLFANESFYVDSTDTIKNIFLFNETKGYGVQLFSYNELDAEEIIKVAEGLKITVLDTTVPYATEEEVQLELEKNKEDSNMLETTFSKTISEDNIYQIGEEIRNPLLTLDRPEFAEFLKDEDDIRFTVENIEIKDAISLSDYPAENFIDYDEFAPWMEEDGTLKPHQRYRMAWGSDEENETLENATSKYVIVKMKLKNYKDTPSMWGESGAPIAPDLTTLTTDLNGNLTVFGDYFRSANEEYHLQWTAGNSSSFPVYSDAIYHTEGTDRMKHALWVPIEGNQELEYTLIYIADEDQLDNMYIHLFSGTGSLDEADITPYVKIR